jgi:DNA helicase-2/ATP-dependent DNA helicase PcrA
VPLLDEDYLILSTIHSAKGQEWRSVFVLNTVDGASSDLGTGETEEIDEERRLLYVAMTRAKTPRPDRAAAFSRPRTAWHGRPPCLCRPNPLYRSAMLPLFETRAWPIVTPEDAERRDAAKQVRIDMAARLRDMWG